MTSTPKSSTKKKKPKNPSDSTGKKKAAKRLLPKLQKADVEKRKKLFDADGMLPPIPDDFPGKREPDDIDVIDDSGIGDSVLGLSGGAVEEFEEYEDSESFEDFVPQNLKSGSEDTKNDPDYKLDIKTQAIKKVLNWSREAPKKRKKKGDYVFREYYVHKKSNSIPLCNSTEGDAMDL
jgi:hypothetical protein